jgi:hypothetical protein
MKRQTSETSNHRRIARLANNSPATYMWDSRVCHKYPAGGFANFPTDTNGVMTRLQVTTEAKAISGPTLLRRILLDIAA